MPHFNGDEPDRLRLLGRRAHLSAVHVDGRLHGAFAQVLPAAGKFEGRTATDIGDHWRQLVQSSTRLQSKMGAASGTYLRMARVVEHKIGEIQQARLACERAFEDAQSDHYVAMRKSMFALAASGGAVPVDNTPETAARLRTLELPDWHRLDFRWPELARQNSVGGF